MRFWEIRYHTVLVVACVASLAGGCQARSGENSAGIRVVGSGTPPQLGFACCEDNIGQTQSLFGQPEVIALLKELHASVAIPSLDFSAQRAEVVRFLNQQGVPVVCWILLSNKDGYYLTADNAAQAASRISDFQKWTSDYGLQWVGVGLDIEPNFAELQQLRNHRWRLITTMLGRSVNGNRLERARKEYSTLVDHIRSLGYPVQIYQMPYLAAERSVHSSLPDRLLGTVDVRADQEYLMLYTSFARPTGAGVIWALGGHSWGITVGVTDGNSPAGTGNGPLDWDEFSRDLLVASHYTRHIGVYDLEGCVRQGFLPRLVAMDWSQSVVIPEESVRRAARLRFVVRSALWIGSNLVYLIAGLSVVGWLLTRLRRATKHPHP